MRISLKLPDLSEDGSLWNDSAGCSTIPDVSSCTQRANNSSFASIVGRNLITGSRASRIIHLAVAYCTNAFTDIRIKMIVRRTHLTALLAIVALLQLCGCAASVRHLKEDVGLRLLAHRAYLASHTPASCQYPKHFASGWKQAYYDISLGGDPCPPSTPPQQYWTLKYQNPEGCRKIASWFSGYHHGVSAAYRDCRPKYSKVPVGSYCERQSAAECNPTGTLGDISVISEQQPAATQVSLAEHRTIDSQESVADSMGDRVTRLSFEMNSQTEGAVNPFRVPIEVIVPGQQ